MNDLLFSRLYDQNTFYKTFERDLKNAQYSVVIESPFIATRRMDHLLPMLHKLSRRGIRVIVNTRSPGEHDGEHALQAIQAIAKMQRMGITVLYTGKLHRKLAIIDVEVLWEGSLNILSQSDSCEVMRRIVSGKMAYVMAQLIGIIRWL